MTGHLPLFKATPAARDTDTSRGTASHERRGLGSVDDVALPCRVSRGRVSFHEPRHARVAAGWQRPNDDLARRAPRGRA